MKDLQIKIAIAENAELVKSLINEMYGIEYEQRSNNDFAEVINNKEQIFVLASLNDKIIGLAGATTNSKEYLDITKDVRTVIEYVYVKENHRGFVVAFELVKALIEELINNNINSALMQVQTFNKQRFLHYSLSDKNIIKSTYCQNYGKKYYDEILLIKDLKEISKISLKEFLVKTHEYSKN
ncbi:MAG: GNAT family N-acetyltransferase [Clostridia bacterium]|nr:GNAT family N-acetyltransferase [Clostridia bacterium]